MDVPREWPELLPALSEAVKSDNEIIKHRGLLYLHHTIKVGLYFVKIKNRGLGTFLKRPLKYKKKIM